MPSPKSRKSPNSTCNPQDKSPKKKERKSKWEFVITTDIDDKMPLPEEAIQSIVDFMDDWEKIIGEGKRG